MGSFEVVLEEQEEEEEEADGKMLEGRGFLEGRSDIEDDLLWVVRGTRSNSGVSSSSSSSSEVVVDSLGGGWRFKYDVMLILLALLSFPN